MAFLIVMVAALSAVLQGIAVLKPLLVIAPVVYAISASMGLYTIQKQPAEAVIDGGRAAIISVWDASGEGHALLDRVYSVLPRQEGLVVGIGDDVTTLRPEDWPDFERIHRMLADAARITELEGENVSWT